MADVARTALFLSVGAGITVKEAFASLVIALFFTTTDD